MVGRWLWCVLLALLLLACWPHARQKKLIWHYRPQALPGIQAPLRSTSDGATRVKRLDETAPIASPSSHPASRRDASRASSQTSRSNGLGVRRIQSVQLAMGTASDRPMGIIRLHLRPEWSVGSFDFVSKVADAAGEEGSWMSNVYRLEPGFLIQGRLAARGVPSNREKPRAPKVMERGEVGWAGGSAGPDYFIYLGNGPASWLGNPHDGTVFAEVADEESLAVAHNVSLLPLGQTIAEGQMHLLKYPLSVGVTPWRHAPDDQPLPRILKVAGTSLDSELRSCPEDCHALARTELHGDVVRWGANHLMDTAAACCAACKAEPKCTIWVYCGSEVRCGTKHRQCWLKQKANVWSDLTLLVGTNPDGWVAGTMDAPPEDHPSGAARLRVTAERTHLEMLILRSPAGPVRMRVQLRTKGAPRSSARLKQMINDSAAGCMGCELLVASRVPRGWGSDSLPDGLSPTDRWPRGAAMIIGTLGPGAIPNKFPPAAIEPDPILMRRGAISWCSSGEATGDGPYFCVALADQPHLGVSQAVWGHVADVDMEQIDELLPALEREMPLSFKILPSNSQSK